MPKPKVKKSRAGGKVGKRQTGRRGGVRQTAKAKPLSSYQDAWKKAGVADLAKFGTLEDGRYEGFISEALIDGDQVKWTVTVTAPEEFADRKVFLSHNLESGIEYLKATLQMLELEIPENVADLPEILHSAKKIPVEVNVRTKWSEKHQRDFTNAFFNGRLDASEGTEEEAEEEVESDFEVGQSVQFESDGEEFTGEVKGIEGDNATVEVNGEEWEVELSELSAVEEEEEEELAKPAKKKKVSKKDEEEADEEDLVGRTVEFQYEGKAVEGEVIRYDDDGNLEVDVRGEEWVIDPDEVTVVEETTSQKKSPKKKKVVKKKF